MITVTSRPCRRGRGGASSSRCRAARRRRRAPARRAARPTAPWRPGGRPRPRRTAARPCRRSAAPPWTRLQRPLRLEVGQVAAHRRPADAEHAAQSTATSAGPSARSLSRMRSWRRRASMAHTYQPILRRVSMLRCHEPTTVRSDCANSGPELLTRGETAAKGGAQVPTLKRRPRSRVRRTPPPSTVVVHRHGLPRHHLHRPARRPGGRPRDLADGMGSSPGGVANLAVAAARLGLRTGLVAAFGGDVYGDYCWSTLGGRRGRRPLALAALRGLALPGHGLAGLRRRPGDGHPRPPAADRRRRAVRRRCPTAGPASPTGPRPGAWVDAASPAAAWSSPTSAGTRPARGTPPRCASGSRAATRSCRTPPRRWPTPAPTTPARRWRRCATGSRSPSSPPAAAAPTPPTSGTGETAWVPGVSVAGARPDRRRRRVPRRARAGHAARSGRCTQRIRFANLCAALSVRDFGGALAAPGWAGRRATGGPSTRHSAGSAATTTSSTTSWPTRAPRCSRARCHHRLAPDPRPLPSRPPPSTATTHHASPAADRS